MVFLGVSTSISTFEIDLQQYYDYYHTSGFGPGCLLSLELCAGLRFSVVVLVWLLFPGLLMFPSLLLPPGLLGPLESGFLKLLGRLAFALVFVVASEVGYCDTTRATDKK